jgi:hypothetical protein
MTVALGDGSLSAVEGLTIVAAALAAWQATYWTKNKDVPRNRQERRHPTTAGDVVRNQNPAPTPRARRDRKPDCQDDAPTVLPERVERR